MAPEEHREMSPEIQPGLPVVRVADPIVEGEVKERRSPRDFVFSGKLSKGIRSFERFASRIGIGRDTLYAITKEKRWVSDDVYAMVAKACECEPGDLHPRDLPTPDRRRQ
jgi:hypothetical protein